MGEWPEGPRGRGRTLLGLTVVMFLFLLTTPVPALTCAPAEVTSAELVAANLSTPMGDYDFAVVGQVVSITTDMSEGDTHGQTFVQMSVWGVFGTTESGQALVVSTPDPGWMSGYPFEEGGSYFVPLLVEGPDGMANFVGACDPVTKVSDAETVASNLATVAAENGVDYVFPVVEGGSGALVTVMFVVLMGGLLFWTGKKRRASRSQLGDTDFGPRRRA